MRGAIRLLAVLAGFAASSGPWRAPDLAAQGVVAATGAPLGDAPRVLILSDQARRLLALQYRSSPTEFLGCMIGDVSGGVVVVRRIAPADVDPAQSTATWVVPRRTCESAGWTGTVGVIHSHPRADRCWYFFPGTQVLSSDGRSFLMTRYPVDAIVCGDRVVWVNRALEQQEVPLTLPRSLE